MVTGSRSYDPPDRWGDVRPRFMHTLSVIHAFFPITEVISGGAVGPDKWGLIWASMNRVEVDIHRPDPHPGESYAAACYRRDMEMLGLEPDLLVSCWDGKSKGTKHTIDGALERGINHLPICPRRNDVPWSS